MLYNRDIQRPFWRGLLHAFAVVLYSLVLSIILLSLNRLFARDIDMVIRLAFQVFLAIVSLAVCAYLIFFEPLRLTLHHHFKAASVLLGSTLGWLLTFLVIFLAGLVTTLGQQGLFF